MSQLIRPKTYTSREAALRQQHPNAILDEADWAEVPANRYVAMVVHEIQPIGFVKAGDLMAIYKGGGITAATPYAPVQKCWSTTVLDLVDDLLHEAQGTNWTHWAESTRKAFLGAASRHTQAQANESRDLTADSQRRVQRLVAIQAALGLTMQDLAAALNLSRPQLYKWLEPSQDVRLQEAKRQRLDTVERIAKAWQARSAAPLRAVAHEPLANGRTVFELLAADAIDEAAVNAAFDELTAKLQAQPKTRSQLLAEAGFKRRPSIRSLPSDE